jgi:preprotein translocase subunit SecG
MGWLLGQNCSGGGSKEGSRVWPVGGKRQLFIASGVAHTLNRYGIILVHMLKLISFLLHPTSAVKGT